MTDTNDKQNGRVLLEVRNLCKYFPIFSKSLFRRKLTDVKAADDVTFDLSRGETLGLVGESGSGKTTVGRTILRGLAPTSGSVLYHSDGKGAVDLASLDDKRLKRLRTEMQMIFQDPFSSLNPRMTVGAIVGEPLLIHKMGNKSQRKDRVVEMLRRVGLKPIHRTRYPHAFSGGQRQRIGIARALVMNPRFVVCDEPVSALDVSVQAQVINLLQDLQEEMQLTYIFIAHDLSVVRHISDRVAVMYAGRIVEMAKTDDLFERPLHPYTSILMSAVPNPDPDKKMKYVVGGEVADPGNLPPGCSFHPRCPYAQQRCRHDRPELREVESGRRAACHFAETLEL